jgi:hypothetical protein
MEDGTFASYSLHVSLKWPAVPGLYASLVHLSRVKSEICAALEFRGEGRNVFMIER